MRGTKVRIDEPIVLVLEECYTCGVPFGITEQSKKYYLDDSGRTFYCPNGHGQSYTGGKAQQITKLEQNLREAEHARKWWKDEAEQAQKKLSATKGQLTKIKKRIAGGACPVCKRQFVNLQRHMSGQHPHFEEQSHE